jgi:transposase-like protein
MKQKTDDYKISAVKYYLKNNDNIRKTCKIFDCKKYSLQRWIKRYEISKDLTRKNREPISYKVKKKK